MKPIMKTKTTSHTPGPWTYDALQKGGTLTAYDVDLLRAAIAKAEGK